MILSFLDTLQEWIEPFREFVFKNHNNPLFWMIVMGIGIGTFFVVYEALNKGN